MSQIAGSAKRYDDTAIDYVMIFDWATGQAIGYAYPGTNGAWTFDYSSNIQCGITYVADGCEPITHGPYSFLSAGDPIADAMTGFLLVKFCQVDYRNTPYDITATNEPTWAEYFSKVKDVGLFDYRWGGAPITAPLEQKTINHFSKSWKIKVWGWNKNGTTDSHLMTFEILDNNNNVLFALKSQTDGASKSGLWFGTNLNSLTKNNSPNSTATSGTLSFTETGVVFSNDASADYSASFSFPVSLSSASAVRVSGEASVKTAYQYANASAYLRILAPE